MEYFQARLFLCYLVATIAMETPVLFFVIRGVLRRPAGEISTGRLWVTGILASACTYPYLWYVLPAVVPDPRTALFLGESLVIMVESLVISGMLRLSPRQAFGASLVCNLVSIILGTLMNRALARYPGFP